MTDTRIACTDHRCTDGITMCPGWAADTDDSAPAVGDVVRIYSRSRWYDENGQEQRARILDETNTWRILRANRHGDWTVQHVDFPGTSHDVFRDDVEHIPTETEAPVAEDAPAVDQVRAQLRAAQSLGRLPESATFHVAAESDGTVNVDVRGMPDAWTYVQTGYGRGQYTGAALQTIETVCQILDGIGSVDAHSVVIESEEEAAERDATEESTPDELTPGMYRVRITVTNRDGVHTATEEMNPAAIELARSRPGWSVEILGASRVTIVAEDEAGEEERRAATRVETDPRTVTGTPENIDARASARARGERAAQLGLTFDESDRQAMTGAQLRATAGDALALF